MPHQGLQLIMMYPPPLLQVDTGGMPYCPGSTPCSGHGRCWSVDGRGLCTCDAGWGGEDCRVPLEGITSSQVRDAGSTALCV